MDDDESTTLARRESGGIARGFVPHTWDAMKELAVKLSRAQGFVPQAMIGEPHQIMAAIMTGLEIGIPPMQALRSIHVIDGRPTLSAELMLSIAIGRGIRHQWLHTDAQLAHLRLERAGFPPHEHRFTWDEAKDAGLTGNNNWRKYPAQMLRARCLSGALTAYCPDVLGAGVYVEGEIEVDDAPPPAREEPRTPPTDVVEGEPLDADLSVAVQQVADRFIAATTREDYRIAREALDLIASDMGDGQKARMGHVMNEAKDRITALEDKARTERRARQQAEDAAIEGALGESDEAAE